MYIYNYGGIRGQVLNGCDCARRGEGNWFLILGAAKVTGFFEAKKSRTEVNLSGLMYYFD